MQFHADLADIICFIYFDSCSFSQISQIFFRFAYFDSCSLTQISQIW